MLARRVDELEAISRDRLETTASGLRAHTEAAVAASQAVALEFARQQAEAAASAVHETTRTHTEKAVRASADETLKAAREQMEASVDVLVAHVRQAGEEREATFRDELHRAIADLRRELRTFERVADGAASARENRPTSHESRTRPIPTDAAFYVALEDRFRGSTDEIERRQRRYLDVVAPLVDDEFPLVDLGFGRGEWLRAAKSSGLPAIGVDTNPAFLAAARHDGLDVVDDDLVDYLRQVDEGSLGAITLFQVVEHLDTDVLLEVLALSVGALRDGGVLIAETPNSLNLQVAASTFWIDPTHVRPLHPEFLQFCAQHVGFSKVGARYANDLAPDYLEIEDPQVRRLAERFDGPGDFALIAWK